MNYIDYLRKKYKKCDPQELATLYYKTLPFKKSKNFGENSLGESYQLAIDYILKEKSLNYYTQYLEIKRRINEQKRFY